MTSKFLLMLLLIGSFQAQAIIGGQSCTEDEFPASLVLIKYFGHRFGMVCGATLIEPDVALTAAHCIEKLSHDFQYFVSAKADLKTMSMLEFRSASKDTVHVAGIAIHTGYDPLKQPGNDIAVVFLSKPLKIEPAKLISTQKGERLKPGLIAHIVGWGQQGIGAKNTLAASSTKHCAETFIQMVAPYEIQLGSIEASARKCFGDSGGATYVEFPKDSIGAPPSLRLAGITSHGRWSDPECRLGGYDTRVDKHLGWIANAIKVYREQSRNRPHLPQ